MIKQLSLAAVLLFPVQPAVQAQSQAAAQQGPASELQQLYTRAQAEQQQGQLEAAAVDWRGFLDEALLELAAAYSAAHDDANATYLLEQARTADPHSPAVLLASARTALLAGDLAGAKVFASTLLALAPKDRETLAEAHQLLGRTLLKLEQDAQARKEFEAAVALDPTFANGYDLAVACLDLADEACAVQVFKEMEGSFGDKPEVHMAFGRAYADSDFQPRAIGEFERVIAEDPHRPGAHYLLAALLLASGGGETSTQSAETALNAELAISPHDPMTYAALGQIALIRNDPAHAIELLQRSIQYGPDQPEGYLYLGQAFYDTGKYTEAEAALRTCIRLTTDVSRNRYQVQKAHYLLGRILMKQGKTDEAHTEMTTSRDLADKALAGDKRKLTGLLDNSQSATEEAAAASSKEATPAPVAAGSKADPALLARAKKLEDDLRPAIAESYNDLGVAAATRGDYRDALRSFHEAAVWLPSLEGLDFNWGRAAFAGKAYGDAIGPLTRYLAAHPADSGAQSVLGFCQFMDGQYKGAVASLQPLAAKETLAPQIDYALGESLIGTGKLGEGTERLRRLATEHPEIAEIHRGLGEALVEAGKKEEAGVELKKAIELDANDARAHLDLGRLELAAGAVSIAEAELETAVRLAPGSQPAHKALAEAYVAAHRSADAQRELDVASRLTKGGR